MKILKPLSTLVVALAAVVAISGGAKALSKTEQIEGILVASGFEHVAEQGRKAFTEVPMLVAVQRRPDLSNAALRRVVAAETASFEPAFFKMLVTVMDRH